MRGKKYKPSVKANNQLRDKVVNEVNAFIYRMERGRFSSEADKEEVLKSILSLKQDADTLNNSVGTGEEDIENVANQVLEALKVLKKSSETEMLHRVQDVVDDLDYKINKWIDVLNGETVFEDEEVTEEAKKSFAIRKLNAKLAELKEVKENFTTHARRLEKEIEGYEKDIKELEDSIVTEENERKINDIYKKIKAITSKLESLTVRQSNYKSCFNMLDLIYVNAAEIIEASELSGHEIGKAKALLNLDKLKKVLTEPDKAMLILKRMQADIESINKRVESIDEKINDMPSTSTVVTDEALAFKAELMKKRREKEILSELRTNETISAPQEKVEIGKEEI